MSPGATHSPKHPAIALGVELFGAQERLTVALWIHHHHPNQRDLFTSDRCARPLGLTEPLARAALDHLRRTGLVGYHSGLYRRVEHPLWKVVEAMAHCTQHLSLTAAAPTESAPPSAHIPALYCG